MDTTAGKTDIRTAKAAAAGFVELTSHHFSKATVSFHRHYNAHTDTTRWVVRCNGRSYAFKKFETALARAVEIDQALAALKARAPLAQAPVEPQASVAEVRPVPKAHKPCQELFDALEALETHLAQQSMFEPPPAFYDLLRVRARLALEAYKAANKPSKEITP